MGFIVPPSSGGGGGGVSVVTASAPLSSSGGTSPQISISTATSTASGALSSTDWATFNNKVGKNAADSTPVNTIRAITQSEYDAIVTKDPNTIYFIK